MKRRRIFGRPQLRLSDVVEICVDLGKPEAAEHFLEKLVPVFELAPWMWETYRSNLTWNGGYKIPEMKWGNRCQIYPLRRMRKPKCKIVHNPNYIGDKLQPRKESL